MQQDGKPGALIFNLYGLLNSSEYKYIPNSPLGASAAQYVSPEGT